MHALLLHSLDAVCKAAERHTIDVYGLFEQSEEVSNPVKQRGSRAHWWT